MPSTSPAQNANDSLLHARAVEAVIWGMPAVNYDLMLQQMLTKTPGKVGQVIYWGRPLDSKNQTLTPNPDALYYMVFFNTKDGPIVLDLPPGYSHRLLQRQHRHRLADAPRRRRPHGRRQRQRRQVRRPSSRLQREDLHRLSSRCNPTPSAATCSSAPTSRATPPPTSPPPSPTASRCASIRTPPPRTRPAPSSSTSKTSTSTPPSSTTPPSSITSTPSSSPKTGSTATAS